METWGSRKNNKWVWTLPKEAIADLARLALDSTPADSNCRSDKKGADLLF